MKENPHEVLCHNCGSIAEGDGIYCESCLSGENGVSAKTDGGSSTKTWDDVKETTSGKLASLAHAMVVGGGLIAILLSLISMAAKYAFGVTEARTVLLITVACLFSGTGIILMKTWTPFRLRVESLQ